MRGLFGALGIAARDIDNLLSSLFVSA